MSTFYVTVNDAAKYLGVTTRTIREMIGDGRLKAYRGGTKIIRIRRDDLDTAMKPYGGWAQ